MQSISTKVESLIRKLRDFCELTVMIKCTIFAGFSTRTVAASRARLITGHRGQCIVNNNEIVFLLREPPKKMLIKTNIHLWKFYSIYENKIDNLKTGSCVDVKRKVSVLAKRIQAVCKKMYILPFQLMFC